MLNGHDEPTHGYVIGINSWFDDQVWVVEDDTDKVSLEYHEGIVGDGFSNWLEAVRAYHRTKGIFLEELILCAKMGDCTPDEVLYQYFFHSDNDVGEVKHILKKKLK